MKKGVLAAMAMAIVVGLGFLLPRWLLSEQQEALFEVRTRRDLSAQLVLKQESDLIGKLTLLHDPNAVIAGVTISDSEGRQAYEILLTELQELLDSGYRSVPIATEEFNQNYHAFEQIYVDQMRVMRAYVIHAETAFAIVDKESHKILQIGSTGAPLERISDALLKIDDGEPVFVENLRAFASYYGLTLGKVSMSETDIFGSDAGAVISARLYDKKGAEVDFGLHLDDDEGFCFIGAITPTDGESELPQYDADLMQSVKGSDAQ